MYCRCIFNVFECFFNVFSIFFNVFSMYFQCIFNVFVFNFNVLGVKYFGMVKYFFRLNYTNGVQSVPICAVQCSGSILLLRKIQSIVSLDVYQCHLGMS